MEQALYHVVLEGRRVGPYDRRTIVGMRMKKTLTSDHIVIDSEGVEQTVADLVVHRKRAPDFAPHRSGSFSIVKATYLTHLVDVEGAGTEIPRFKGEVETRVQGDVLRLAGRFRQGLGWKEDRVKLPLSDVVHARIKGAQVELWLRQPGVQDAGVPLQRIVLDLGTHVHAGELVEWLPAATPFPTPGMAAVPAAAKAKLPATRSANMLWVPVIGLTLVVGLVVAVLAFRRLY